MLKNDWKVLAFFGFLIVACGSETSSGIPDTACEEEARYESDGGSDMMQQGDGYITTRPNNQVERQGGGGGINIRRKSEIIDLFRFTNIAILPAISINRTVDVYTASSRVNVSVEIFYDNDLDESQLLVSNSEFVIDAYAKGINRNASPISRVFPDVSLPPETLPGGYEYASNVNIARVRTFLGSPTRIGPFPVPGTWYLRATWEPAMEISDAELNAIFSNSFIRAVDFNSTGNFGP